MDRRQSALLLALTAITIAVGAWLLHSPGAVRLPADRASAGAELDGGATSFTAPPTAEAQQAALAEARQTGLRLRIPAIEVNAPVQRLRVRDDDTHLPAPHAPEVAGIISNLTARSDGPQLVVGHVNWHTGEPAVFARLAEVQPGDTIILEQRGVERAFLVRSVEDVDAVGTSAQSLVEGEEDGTLMLMTCSGDYRADLGMYDQRRVVIADRVDY